MLWRRCIGELRLFLFAALEKDRVRLVAHDADAGNHPVSEFMHLAEEISDQRVNSVFFGRTRMFGLWLDSGDG